MWQALQTEDDRSLDPEFAPSGDHVLVRWRQKGHRPDGGALDIPCVSVYELRAQKVIDSMMHHLDTAALLEFLRPGR